ncbi:MAG: NADPH-dependent ferric siderophore reductase [Rhizobiales bacterium 32-66-8]|nr:MAG: NADPH-dependent ferric siderophore reductase [Rhizobiales bacterium 32-66-8]
MRELKSSSPTQSPASRGERHAITRVRHGLKLRILTVQSTMHLTPGMVRVTFTGDDLADFASSGFDDHIKLFLPQEDAQGALLLPSLPGETKPPPEGGMPVARDYTPRRFDPVRRELEIDFAIHDSGPITRWALEALPGQQVAIGGPRGSFLVADDFDWYLLVGDESALPAIGRRLEELPVGAQALVIVEVASEREQLALESRARTAITWLHRGQRPAGTTDLLENAVRDLVLPPGDGYAWVACESLVAKRLRQSLVEDRGMPKAWVKASGYWKRGAAGFHQEHGD